MLLGATCPRNINGDFIAPELAEEQTLDRLYAFGDRLHEVYTTMTKPKPKTKPKTKAKAKAKAKKRTKPALKTKPKKPIDEFSRRLIGELLKRREAVRESTDASTAPCKIKQHFDCSGTGVDELDGSKCKDCDGTGRFCVEHDSACGDMGSLPKCDVARGRHAR